MLQGHLLRAFKTRSSRGIAISGKALHPFSPDFHDASLLTDAIMVSC
jgi:hypothetical protein